MSRRKDRGGGMSAAAFGATFSSGARFEDSPPNVEHRSLRFEGGVVDLDAMPEAHAGGVTPTTTARQLVLDELTDAAAFILDARKLLERGLAEEARFDLRMAARHINNALQWSEP